jgi:hypothetical protein
MPYMKDGKRDYKTEYKKYHADSTQKKNRAQRNKARSMMTKAGKAHKGDGKDVGHKTAMSKGGLSKMYNLQMQSKSGNRSFSRNKDGSMKSERSKRGK